MAKETATPAYEVAKDGKIIAESLTNLGHWSKGQKVTLEDLATYERMKAKGIVK